MTRDRLLWTLAIGFMLLWLALWKWQNPGSRIGAEEAAKYIAQLEKLPFPAAERNELMQRARQWMASDDGQPVYMLNLMRYHPQLERFAGTPAFNGTPRESNAIYESRVMPKLFKVGGYPVYGGDFTGKNLITFRPELDDWSRLLVVRYPNRRAFMELVTDPEYMQIEPYKLMGVAVVLSPTLVEASVPELHWIVGALLLTTFLAIGWRRAARRAAA